MKNIKYCLSLVAGMNNCRIRVLSLFAALLAISQISFADTYYYYIDCRALDRTAFQINWVYNQDQSKTPTASLNDPESGIIKITTDFAVGNESSSKLKFDLSYTGNTVRVEHISNDCLGSNNCIKLETGAKNNCDLQNGCSYYSFIKYTVYGATPVTNYTITPSPTNCTISPNTAQTVSSAGSQVFRITPNSGYQLSSVSCDGATLSPNTVSGTSYVDVTVRNPSQNATFYASAVAVAAKVPVVRIGKKIKEESNYDVTVSGYIAENVGCTNITKFTIYYANNPTFTNEGDNKASYKDHSITPSASANILYDDLTITASELRRVVTNGETLYVKITATNGVGASDYSDIVSLTYSQCANYVSAVSISPSSRKFVQGETYEITAVIDNPDAEDVVYTWGDDAAGKSGQVIELTMNSAKSVSVTVTESTCSSNVTSETVEYTVCTGELTDVSLNCPVGKQDAGTPISLTATPTGTADSYVWYVDGVLVPAATTASYNFTPSTGKKYSVRVVATGCPDRSVDAVCVIDALANFSTIEDQDFHDWTACSGAHEFTWSGMFVPTPDKYEVLNTTGGGSAVVTSDFEVVGNKMVWKPKETVSGSYTFEFTASKEGFNSATATLSIDYSRTDTEQTIDAISQSPNVSVTGTTPWTKIELTSGIPGESDEVVKITWSVSPEDGIIVVTDDSGEAYFKGPDLNRYYTITAIGLTSDCGTTAPQTTNINVQRTSEDCDD